MEVVECTVFQTVNIAYTVYYELWVYIVIDIRHSVLIDVSAPKITQHPAKSHLFELYTNNVNLTLQCEAVGYQVSYTWIKNGRPIAPNNRYSTVDGNLSIINMKESDKGRYQCTASNIGGKVSSVDAQVDIKGTSA